MQTHPSVATGGKFWRATDIARDRKNPNAQTILPISIPTLWRWVKEGKFPAPVKLSAGVTAWRSSDVETWLASQQSK